MIIASFLGPFLLNFIIWMVILDMQFLWLYIDDLMGKGLEWNIILELLTYASANWVPLALPLSVLLASIMTFGSLGEKKELLALKASGISLFKIMKPLMVVIFFIALFAFYFTNSLWPVANFKMRVLLRDIQNTKVALVLKPGVFFKSDLFSIRIGEKSNDGREFNDVLIYDHSNMTKQSLGSWSYKKDPRDFKRVIRAKKGKLINPDNKEKLELELLNGYMIQEWNTESFKNSKLPFTKYNFEKTTLYFELNAFEFERSSENSYKRDQYLLSLNQIYNLNDSLKTQKSKQYEKIETFLTDQISFLNDTLNNYKNPKENYLKLITKSQSKAGIKKDHKVAIKKLDQLRNHLKIAKAKEISSDNFITNLKIEWNRKFTLSYAVVMLFFLGAPLGSIVKKGGLGWPVITAVLIFLVYFILTRAGEEMSSNYSLSPSMGMWLSSICITPISIFIFFKANRDAKIFDIEWYSRVFQKIIKF
jgi:lipopolysaccharide export system permease protein